MAQQTVQLTVTIPDGAGLPEAARPNFFALIADLAKLYMDVRAGNLAAIQADVQQILKDLTGQ